VGGNGKKVSEEVEIPPLNRKEHGPAEDDKNISRDTSRLTEFCVFIHNSIYPWHYTTGTCSTIKLIGLGIVNIIRYKL